MDPSSTNDIITIRGIAPDTMAESNTKARTLRKGPMTPKVLEGIFASDQDMYPAPLTRERLDSWAAAAPEMAWCFYLADSPEPVVGAVIALPMLAASWNDLLVGKIKETDVDPETMFPAPRDEGSAVGLHIFHVERFQVPEASSVRGFADISMRTVVEAAEEKGWKVVGHSGECFADLNYDGNLTSGSTHSDPRGTTLLREDGIRAHGLRGVLGDCRIVARGSAPGHDVRRCRARKLHPRWITHQGTCENAGKTSLVPLATVPAEERTPG